MGEGGEGRGVLFRIGVNCRIWTKSSTTPAGSCITDSLSHTTYVETNTDSLSHTTYVETNKNSNTVSTADGDRCDVTLICGAL